MRRSLRSVSIHAPAIRRDTNDGWFPDLDPAVSIHAPAIRRDNFRNLFYYAPNGVSIHAPAIRRDALLITDYFLRALYARSANLHQALAHPCVGRSTVKKIHYDSMSYRICEPSSELLVTRGSQRLKRSTVHASRAWLWRRRVLLCCASVCPDSKSADCRWRDQ